MGFREQSTKREGGEQGDLLMPLLFSIGIQSALREVAESLRGGEQLCAYLDDLYLLCQPERITLLHKVLADSLLRNAGIRLLQGKTRTWNQAGVIPENVEALGPDVWQPQGITVLRTPIGSKQYIFSKMAERITKERDLWKAIPRARDLQCAWQLLSRSANPRANHTMRTMPPRKSRAYFQATTRASGRQPKFSWTALQENMECNSWRLYRCRWEGWGCVLLKGARPRHIGHHGQMHSR